MLEVRNLYKDYRSKTGVTVRATDGVSLKFRKTGMVFIVGKSGCGKSTLLNLLGGLDTPDGGEIIINGTSSLKFRQSDFDSYRNTYVGFIFQEYNLLKDFSVGANVALALELQSVKATNEKINEILASVDLDGYGNRRINELSGGQKQRVAIARALVKSPEIILADEPSGALDSASAQGLFETLKRLSKTKLVIVVSHDREFAKRYGDRIIEMSDGRVISDLEKSEAAETDAQTEGLEFSDGKITIPEKYVLTVEDLKAINEYLSTAKKTVMQKHATATKVEFSDFDALTVEEEREEFKPIKSSLPLRKAFKMGASNLAIKKFRLILTIFLSVISFVTFGLYSVMAFYDERDATINSVLDTNIEYASFKKMRKKYIDENDEGSFYYNSVMLDDDDLKNVENGVGVKMNGVYSLRSASFSPSIANLEEVQGSIIYNFYSLNAGGFVEVDNLSKYGLSLLPGSTMPTSFNEILLPEYLAKTFVAGGYKDQMGREYTISKPEDMIDRQIRIQLYSYQETRSFSVCGVFKTDTDFSKYEKLLSVNMEAMSTADVISNMLVARELSDLNGYSFNGMMLVKPGFIQNEESSGVRYNQASIEFAGESISPNIVRSVDTVTPTFNDSYFTGKTELEANEILLSKPLWNHYVQAIQSKEPGFPISLYIWDNDYNTVFEGEIKIVGNYENGELDSIAVSPEIYERFSKVGKYSACFGSFDGSRANVTKIVDFSYQREGGDYYAFTNYVTSNIDLVTTIFDTLRNVFVWIGVVFAVFASLLLSNFIALGVINKKTEIGILRAIGARSSDVFKVFFSESAVIAAINFVLSCIGTAVLSVMANKWLYSATGLLLSIMNFGILQVGVLFVISFAIAAIASFLPVYRLAKKKPVDVILNK